MAGERWTVQLSPRAQHSLNAARRGLPETGTLYNSISMRLSHDPFTGSRPLGDGRYAMVVDTVTPMIPVETHLLYSALDNGQLLTQALRFVPHIPA